MKKQEEQKQIIDLDEFDNSVSLYQLIPSGKGTGKEHLKTIVDAYFNSPSVKSDKPLSILIYGKHGLSTHARAFLRALGFEYTEEVPAIFLGPPISALHEFLNPELPSDSHIVSMIETSGSSALKNMYEIITKGQCAICRHGQFKETIAVNKPIIMTTHHIEKIPDFLTRKVDHVVHVEDYTQQQLELIVLQRIKYCQQEYDEEVLKMVVEKGQQNLHRMIRVLKDAFTAMMADGRAVLTVRDVAQVANS